MSNLRFLFDPKDQTLGHEPEANKKETLPFKQGFEPANSIGTEFMPSSFGYDSWLAVGGIGHALCSVVHVWDQSRPV